MVNLKDVSSGESVHTSGSTGETAVLYMGSGWDIHPEGNLKKETIGNKAKSFQRHQRAVLRTWAVELGCSPGFSIYSEYNSPSFKVNPPHKGERAMGLELRWDLRPPLHRNVSSTVAADFLCKRGRRSHLSSNPIALSPLWGGLTLKEGELYSE